MKQLSSLAAKVYAGVPEERGATELVLAEACYPDSGLGALHYF